MIKPFVKGILIGIGFILGLYICSHISILGIGGSLKEFSTSIGKMFINIGR